MRAAVLLVIACLCGCGSHPPRVEPSPVDPSAVWHVVAGFPPEGAVLTAVSAFGENLYLVAGSVAAGDEQCPDKREARLWSSSDGRHWFDVNTSDAADGTVDVLPAGGSGWPAVGRIGSQDCPGDGTAAWGPSAMSGWDRLPTAGLEFDDEVVDIVAVGDSDDLVATGYFAGDQDAMGVWTVRLDTNAMEWTHAAVPPRMSRKTALSSLANQDDTVIAFDGTPSRPAWYSPDAGQTWVNSDLQTPYTFAVTDSAAGSGGFLSVGRVCCGLPGELVGNILSSVDGQTWTQGGDLRAFGRPIETIVSTGVGWIALGEETYLSVNGFEWHVGPPLPGYEPQDVLLNGEVIPYRLEAAAQDTVVAITPTRVWHASLADLDPALWPETAPEAELPEIGSQYEYSLFTHCGPSNGSLQVGLRSWTPDLPDNTFPRSFDSFYEPGSLTLVADDRLEFTGRAGDVVEYSPTENPPASFPCA